MRLGNCFSGLKTALLILIVSSVVVLLLSSGNPRSITQAAVIIPGPATAACLSGEESLEIKEEATIECSLESNGDIEIKERAMVFGEVVSADGNLELKEGANIEGNLLIGRKVELKEHSLVRGDVTSGGEVELKENARVEGDVTSGGRVKLHPTAMVTGTITQFAVLPPIPPIAPLSFSFGAGGSDVVIAHGGYLALPPGSYGRLTSKAESTLLLSSGEYFFTKFELGERSFFNFDLSGGPIAVSVTLEFGLKELTTMTIISAVGEPADLTFQVKGETTLKEDGQYLGVFQALEESELKEDATLLGSLRGKKVKVKERSRVAF